MKEKTTKIKNKEKEKSNLKILQGNKNQLNLNTEHDYFRYVNYNKENKNPNTDFQMKNKSKHLIDSNSIKRTFNESFIKIENNQDNPKQHKLQSKEANDNLFKLNFHSKDLNYEEFIKNVKNQQIENSINAIKTENKENKENSHCLNLHENFKGKNSEKKGNQLYINQNGSPCEFNLNLKRKISWLKKFKQSKRILRRKQIFSNKANSFSVINSNQDFNISNNKLNKNNNNNNNNIKNLFLYDRINHVYVVRKNLYKLSQIENPVKEKFKKNKYLKRIFYKTSLSLSNANKQQHKKKNFFQKNNTKKKILCENIKEIVEEAYSNNNSNLIEFDHKNNSIIKNKQSKLENSFNKSSSKSKPIQKDRRKNSYYNTNLFFNRFSKQGKSINNLKNKVTVEFHCFLCSKEVKFFYTANDLKFKCKYCKGNCLLEKILSTKDNKIIVKCICYEKSNPLCISFSQEETFSKEFLITNSPLCKLCDIKLDIGLIRFKENKIQFFRYVTKFCSKCNLVVYRKIRKKYISKNGFIIPDNNINFDDKCTRCLGDLIFMNSKLTLKSSINEEYAILQNKSSLKDNDFNEKQQNNQINKLEKESNCSDYKISVVSSDEENNLDKTKNAMEEYILKKKNLH